MACRLLCLRAMPALPSAYHQLRIGLASYGVDLGTWRPEFIMRRLRRAALLSGDVFVDRHVERLIGDARAAESFLDDLSIGVSEFFRDPLSFAFLEELTIPELCRAEAPPRALSLGCARGQEAWSVAMLLAERREDFEVLGLDRHAPFIEAARRGVYERPDLERVSFGRMHRWFEPGNGSWTITPSLQSNVRFAVKDLAEAALADAVAPRSVQLVLCRNVFIYFSRRARERLVEAISQIVSPGGFLVLGSADVMPETGDFEQVSTRGRVFRRVS